MPRDQEGLRPRAAPWPFIAQKAPTIIGGEGSWLICDDGRRILDAAGGAIVANVGHGRAEVMAAIAKATPAFVVPTWRTPEREALSARLLDRWLPAGLAHVHLTSGGSEGVEAAVKIALQHHAALGHPERTLIMGREVSYHGATLAMAGLSGHAARKRGMEGFLTRHPSLPTPWPLRSPLGPHHPAEGARVLAASRAAIEAAGPERVAAIVTEPITGSSGGAIVPPQGYLAGLRALADEFGILVIVDEVMTGFGRTGTRFACEALGCPADILVSGKGLGGGYAAICGVYATPRVAEPISASGDLQVMFHTFAALPVSCAAAQTVLAIMERENLVARAAAMGARLGEALTRRLGQHPHVAEVRGMGLLQAVEIVRDRETLEPFPEAARITNRVVGEGLKRDVFFYPGGTGAVRDIICLGPPFTVTESEIEQMADALAQSLDAALERAGSSR